MQCWEALGAAMGMSSTTGDLTWAGPWLGQLALLAVVWGEISPEPWGASWLWGCGWGGEGQGAGVESTVSVDAHG